MQFILNGFSQHMRFRMFAFEGIAEDRTRTPYTVKADTALTRKYGIQVQELPLLCRKLLERCDQGPERPTPGEKRELTFTEEDMLLHAKDLAAARDAAAQKKKFAQKPAASTD